jgi:hypothetical protein
MAGGAAPPIGAPPSGFAMTSPTTDLVIRVRQRGAEVCSGRPARQAKHATISSGFSTVTTIRS